MPPKQCPYCGRFLKNALVEGLAEGAQPCPGCQATLASELFDAASGSAEGAASTPSADGSPAAGAAIWEPTEGGAGSVRPPDLRPDEVRDDGSDVLESWDRGAGPAEIASWDQDGRPFPIDAVVVAASGLVGGVVGGLLLRHRLRGALVGGLLGAVVAAVIRQVWRLPD